MKALLIGFTTWAFLSLSLLSQKEPDLPLEINSPNLTIDHLIGFGEFGFNDDKNIATFRVHNKSERVLRGKLVVEGIYFRQGEIAHRQPIGTVTVELGQGSQQSMSLLLSGFRAGSLVASFREDSGKTLWQRYAFVEFIESRAARIHLWSVTPDTSVLEAGPQARGLIANVSRQTSQPALGVRPLYDAKIPAWALPSVTSHLAFGDGILLGQDALSRLTGAQEAAVANYVALGGILILPREAQSFETSLWARAPFEVTSLESQEAHFGLGKVLRYALPTLTQSTREENAWIYKALDETPKRDGPIITPSSDRYHFLGRRAWTSILACAWFAGLFMLTTGPVAWLFRKAPRRRFLWFLGSAIGVFCIAAALLGLYLQQKKGELWWTTMTEIAPQSGGIQTGAFEAESAGARQHQVHTDTPEVAFLPREDWNTNTAPSLGSASIPLLPWRKGTLTCEHLLADCSLITLHLDITSPTTMRMSWDNPNAFKIEAVQLVITTNQGRPVDAFEPRPTKASRTRQTDLSSVLYGSGFPKGASQVNMTLDWQSRLVLPDISLSNYATEGDSEEAKLGASISYDIPWKSRRWPYNGFVLFQVDRSPGFEIDEEKTGFVSSSGLHYVVQRIPSEALPEYEELFTKAPYPTPKTKDRTKSRRRVIPR